ncbi:MAG: 2'-5' RNA ligase family protein, partial [Acidimicrobiales bacterium]|nr:2'-5' RNA ligase family protein [Acidimicrobiales bacterium]
AIEPFVIHAHGYGFFTGDNPANLTLHVPVVRAEALDSLHGRLWAQLVDAGAEVAPWSAPDLWTPHLTVLDRALDPPALGAAATWLARRHHPSWSILVDRVVLTGGWPDRTGRVLPLGEL